MPSNGMRQPLPQLISELWKKKKIQNRNDHGASLFSEELLLLLTEVALLTEVLSFSVAVEAYLITSEEDRKPRQYLSILIYMQITKGCCRKVYSNSICLEWFILLPLQQALK